MKNDEYDVYKIIEELSQLHVTQTQLHKKEQELTRRLVIATRGQKDSFKAPKRSESFKARAVAGRRYRVTEEGNELHTSGNITPTRIADITAANNVFDQVVCPTKNKTDKFGNYLKIGDKVEFLTAGTYKAKHWEIYKLTEKRVLCKRKGSQKTHREYHNVKKVLT